MSLSFRVRITHVTEWGACPTILERVSKVSCVSGNSVIHASHEQKPLGLVSRPFGYQSTHANSQNKQQNQSWNQIVRASAERERTVYEIGGHSLDSKDGWQMLTRLLWVVMLVMDTMTPRDCVETPVWIIQATVSTVVLSKAEAWHQSPFQRGLILQVFCSLKERQS